MGLGAAIEGQLDAIKKKLGVQTEFNQPADEIKLPEAIKSGLFRIVQESLTNIARYANCKSIKVDLFEKSDHVHLSIRDDGDGFDQQLIEYKKTLGILGMKERTYMMGGQFHLRSAPGKGTSIEITVPLNGGKSGDPAKA